MCTYHGPSTRADLLEHWYSEPVIAPGPKASHAPATRVARSRTPAVESRFVSDTAAIISVAASATVAIVVALITGLSQARLARQERARSRAQGLREILDKALDPLFQASIKLQFVLRAEAPDAIGPQRFFSPMPADFNPPQAVREADDLRIDVWLWEIRLKARLGAEHPIVERYGRAMLELRRASAAIAGGGDPLEAKHARDAWHHVFEAQEALGQAAEGVIRLEENTSHFLG